MKKLLSITTFAIAALGNPAQAATKPVITLVHGAFEDASVWTQTKAKLEADGFKVIAVNLPGHPGNPLSPAKASLKIYRDTVLNAIKNERRPVVLVGHSFGGITISMVGEAAPKKFKTLVYLAAGLPLDGQSLVSLTSTDKDGKMGPHLQIDKERGVASIEYTARADLFANDGSEALRKAIPDLILDENLGPLAEPVHVTASRFGRIDKVYIHTAKDQVVSPTLQAAMVKATPVRLELTLDTGHAPFLTNPDGLAMAIEAAAE